MQVKRNARTSPGRNAPLQTRRNGARTSFRDLKAFGLWKDRTDLKDAVHFTKQLRSRMEQGHDA